MSHRNKREIAVLAYDGMGTFEFGIAVEVFGLPRPEVGRDWYRFAVCSLERKPVRSTAGVSVRAGYGLSRLSRAGTIIIPGWTGYDAPVPPRLISTLRNAHSNGARLVSICSGVFVLAATGLLNGRRATTHWRYAEALQLKYPEIEVVPDVLYVDEGRILTSAGSAAGIDLCLHIVRQDFGARGQQSGPAARRGAASRRRPGAVHRARGRRRGPPVARGAVGVGAAASRRAVA